MVRVGPEVAGGGPDGPVRSPVGDWQKGMDVDHPEDLWNILIVTFLLSPHAYYYDLIVLLIPLLWYAKLEPRRAIVSFLLLAVAILGSSVGTAWLGVPDHSAGFDGHAYPTKAI